MPIPGTGLLPSTTLLPGDPSGPGYGDGSYGGGTYGALDFVVTPPAPTDATIHVRELPPLRQSIEIITPSGRNYRWSEDEPNPAYVPQNLRHSSTMPGGYESLDVSLPRKPGVDYADLDRLTTIRVSDAGGDIIGEYRLERAPRVSGDHMAISPSAVGWQAHLTDDKSASMIYIDRSLSRWEGASSQRRVNNAGVGRQTLDTETASDISNGVPTLRSVIRGAWGATGLPISEALYDAGSGNRIGRIRATGTRNANVDSAQPAWDTFVVLMADDYTATGDSTGDIHGAGPYSVDLTATTSTRRWATIIHYFNTGPGGSDGVEYAVGWSDVRVFGNHGLSIRGSTAATEGVLASDVVAHAVSRWAPLLSFTVGETVLNSSFVIPQLAFFDSTTAADIIQQATRYGLQDWAVWDDKTFYWHDRGLLSRKWRARIAPTQLEETGPQLDRLWESILVQYQDVDGSTRTAGPPGSGADTEDAVLQDDDPDNPANQLGIIRRDLLVMGVGTAASATEIGRRFLEQSKLLDSSGRARIVGHVTDDHGVLFPYTSVRAGDTIAFTDAADTSDRRIVRVDHDRSSRSCSIDLDAPPEGLAALLERLNVVLVPLGL